MRNTLLAIGMMSAMLGAKPFPNESFEAEKKLFADAEIERIKKQIRQEKAAKAKRRKR